MDIRVKSSLFKERELMEELLDNLDEQHKLLVSTDADAVAVFSMAEKIDSIAKEIALTEIERRKIISNEDLISEIELSTDEDCTLILKELSRLKKLISNQNELNNAFVKQNLLFTKKMLKMITPSEKFDTYNNSGKLSSQK